MAESVNNSQTTAGNFFCDGCNAEQSHILENLTCPACNSECVYIVNEVSSNASQNSSASAAPEDEAMHFLDGNLSSSEIPGRSSDMQVNIQTPFESNQTHTSVECGSSNKSSSPNMSSSIDNRPGAGTSTLDSVDSVPLVEVSGALVQQGSRILHAVTVIVNRANATRSGTLPMITVEQLEALVLVNQIKPDVAPGMEPEEIKSLPTVKISEDLVNNETICVICRDKFIKNQEVILLGCPHVFHSDCIGEWLGIHGICPLCKKTVECNVTSSVRREPPGPDNSRNGSSVVV